MLENMATPTHSLRQLIYPRLSSWPKTHQPIKKLKLTEILPHQLTNKTLNSRSVQWIWTTSHSFVRKNKNKKSEYWLDLEGFKLHGHLL